MRAGEPAEGNATSRRPMFPLYDENPTEISAVITLGLIAATVAVWVWVQGAGLSVDALTASVCELGAIPAEITGRPDALRDGSASPCSPGGLTWEALLSSMFLHGSWMHLIGNLWFLWVFGNNVEDSMGHLRFLAFYVVTGLVAAGAHVASDPASAVPVVGASGAVSGIMGAYLVLYPRVRVHMLFIIIILVRVIPIPAWVVLLYWFGIQLASAAAASSGMMVGVAFWAHVGGFVAGVLLVKPFENPTLVNAKRNKVKLAPSEIRHGGWW